MLKTLKPYCIFITALFISVGVFAQSDIEKYVRSSTVNIPTINPDSTDYADLKVIGDAIGNDSLVMLGEEDHGDAPAFLAKTRLIKYLHEKKGFNVLAFESDFFALNEGWDKLNKTPYDIKKFIFNNVFGVWTMCDACSKLFYHYIPDSYQTKEPLIVTGFDCQQYQSYSAQHLKTNLNSLVRDKKLPIINRPDYASKIWPLIDSSLKLYRHPPDAAVVDSSLKYLGQIKNELVSTSGKDDFWILVLDNFIEQIAAVKVDKQTGINNRDVQMAKNLKWLVENKYKGQKIIVWAASRHIARSLKNSNDTLLKTAETMGDNLVKGLPVNKRIYILGFTSYDGEAGRIGRDAYKVQAPGVNVFESWVNAKGYPYAFVDFGGYNALHPEGGEKFYMAPLGHSPDEDSWNRVFDGIFFIRDMYRCVVIDHRPY